MRGFTLVELLVVIAIAGILSAGGFASIANIRETYGLMSAADTVKISLEKSRLSALSREDGGGYGLKFGESDMIWFKGPSFDPNSPSNRTIGLPAGTKIQSVDLGGGDSVVFNNLTGTTTAGTIVVASASDPSKTRTIYVSGSGKIYTLAYAGGGSGGGGGGGGGGGSSGGDSSPPTQPVGNSDLTLDLGWSIQDTSELKFRFLDDPSATEIFIMTPHFNGDRSVFNYVGYFNISGETQKVIMYSNQLDPTNTVISIIREPSGSMVPLEISIDDRALITYFDDGNVILGSWGGTIIH